MNTYAGIRCDICGRLEIKRKPLVIRGETSMRPEEGSRDRYFDFVIPPSISKITGKPDGRFNGMAREDQPGVLLAAHTCPPCAIDLRKVLNFKIGRAVFKDGPWDGKVMDAIQITAIGDVMQLKSGPLREFLLGVKSRNIFPNLGNA